jgi:choline transport protein
MIIALLFSLGDLDEVLAAPVSQLGYPVIQIYYQATGSLHGANAMTVVSLVIVIMAHFGLMAGCSRTAWAFARDRGLPASDYLSHVSTRSQVPFRAIMLSVVIQVLLGLINIGSSAAFLAFVNAAAATLYITYVKILVVELCLNSPLISSSVQITPVILGVLKRRRGEHIPYGPFQLGKYRNVINGVAIVYTLFTTFFLLWPATAHPDASSMNWTIVLIGGVLTFSGFWWFVEGRKSFVGPDIDATLNRRDT